MLSGGGEVGGEACYEQSTRPPASQRETRLIEQTHHARPHRSQSHSETVVINDVETRNAETSLANSSAKSAANWRTENLAVDFSSARGLMMAASTRARCQSVDDSQPRRCRHTRHRHLPAHATPLAAAAAAFALLLFSTSHIRAAACVQRLNPHRTPLTTAPTHD